MKRRSTIAAGVLGMSLLLAGCSTPTPPTSTSATAQPSPSPTATVDPDAWAAEWELLDLPGDLASAEYTTAFYAGGRYWIMDHANQFVWQGTADGETWETLDLTDSGLPENAFANAPIHECGVPVVFDDHGDSFDLVYLSSYNGSHPQGINLAPWIVSVGEDVTVTSGASIGLEALPGAIDGWDFRTSCPSVFVDFDGSRRIVGTGQWWQPYKTGSSDAYFATEAADGTWSVHSSRGPFLGADGYSFPLAATVIDGVLTVFGKGRTTGEGTMDVWTTTDGSAWELSVVPGSKDDYYYLTALETDTHYVVATGTINGAVGAWVSTDGTSWSHQELHPSADFVGAVEGPFGVEVFASISVQTVAYRLAADGTWTERTLSSGPYRLANLAVLPNGKVIGVVGSSLYVTK